MKIRRLHLDKFTVFKSANVEFCDGINVIVGPNGTGKSHLLKLLYSALKSVETAAGSAPGSPEGLDTLLPQKLARVFKPDGSGLNRLITRRKHSKDRARVRIETSGGDLGFVVTATGKFKLEASSIQATAGAIYFPSREVLALYEGFIAAYEKRELSFDETYKDLCVALQSDALRGPRSAEIAALAKPFERDVLEGNVRLDGGRFEVYNNDGVIEAHLLSEGQRKIASLVRLMVNGSLTRNALLFWDEPEANLNPRLVTRVARALRALAAGGVQIFVSTHDYLLTQELSLAAEYPATPADAGLSRDLRFIALSRGDPSRGVTVQSADTMSGLGDNPILDEFVAHYRREQSLAQAE